MTKALLVTGGSRGIGAAICRMAAGRGFDVCVNYAGRADAAEAVAADVRAQGRRALTVRADVCDEAAVVAMFDRCTAELGPLAACVVNAGIINRAMPLAEMDYADVRRLVDINVNGALLTCREAVRRMARSKGGRGGAIVITSSMASVLGGAGEFIPYAVSKGGTDVLAQGLGREVAGEGIRVNALRPGLIETEIHADSGKPERLQTLGSSVPIGRTGSAEEVAEAALWLLSDASSYVAGALLNVSGGR